MAARAYLDGVGELQADLAKMVLRLPSELENANRGLGQRAVGRASPRPLEVGTGEGAAPAPYARGRVLILQAGGPWRAQHTPGAAWGAQPGPPRDSPRPYLIRTFEEDVPTIEGKYLGAVLHAAASIGWPPMQMMGI